MAGQIIGRGERTWLVRVWGGQDSSGKRTSHNKTIHGTKKDAQTYLNGVLRERDLGTFASPTNTSVATLLDALLLDYKTNGKSLDWATIVVDVHLRPFFGGMKASAVGTDQIQGYVALRRQAVERNGRTRPPASNGTINRELAVLRRAFNLGKQSTPPRVTVTPWIPKLTEAAPRKGFFERAAFVAIRQALPEEIRPLITMAYHTGCRRGELLGLLWRQVDLAERLVRLESDQTKNGEARVIPLSSELYEVLTIQKQQRDELWPESPWVFSRLGQRIISFKGSWAAACTKAGLVDADGQPEALFHDLRRTGVRNLIRAGVPETVAMRISGHKTRSMLDRYNVTNEADLREAARRLDGYLAHKDAEHAALHTNRTHSGSGTIQ